MTTERLMVCALSRGLSLSDFENLTIGMIIDFIITHDNMHDDDEETEKEAGQSDFDNF